MADLQPNQHLYDNLLILHQLNPGNTEFAKCIKEDMFSKPNRSAFDQTLYYLCRTYDSGRYLPKIPWPILDRSQERNFRQNTVAFIKEIIQERPAARIPSFSPSFLSTPGGDRLIKFMWKFSLLVLKTVIERESDEPVLDYPTTGIDLINALTEMNLEELRKGINELCDLIVDANTYADKLKNDLKAQSEELKSLQSESRTLIQSLDFLSEEEKTLLSSGNRCQWETVTEKWSDIFNTRTDEATKVLKVIEIECNKIKECRESVKKLVDSKTMPIILDGSQYPPNVKDCNGNVDIADLLFQASKAASSISKTISSSGGLQPLHSVLPYLKSMHSQLQSVETSLSETKAGYAKLLTASSDDCANSRTIPDVGPDTPTLKGGLKLGYEMLRDAQMSTPPLVFNIDSEVLAKPSISAESPPIEALVGRSKVKALGKQLSDAETSFTPKASKSLMRKDLSARLMESKAQRMGALNKSIPSNVMVTPARFGQKLPATSTVCKPASLLNGSKSNNGVIETPAHFGHTRPTSSTVCKQISSLNRPKSDTIIETPAHFGQAQPTTSTVCKQSSFQSSSKGSTLPSKPKLEHSQGPGNKSLPHTKSLFTESVEVQKKSIDLRLSELNLSDDALERRNQARDDIGQREDLSLKEKDGGKEEAFEGSNTAADRGLDVATNLHKTAIPSPLNQSRQVASKSHLKEKQAHQSKVTVFESPLKDSHTKSNVTPKVVVSDTAHASEFDSPLSSSILFSPASADNSFFNDSDRKERTSIGPAPKFDLEFDDDDISPSGRVSLCPSNDVEEPSKVVEPLSNAPKADVLEAPKPSSKRRSLQAIISRYRDLVASSKAYEPVKVSPPSSPEPDLSEEDPKLDISLNLDHDL